jgi:KaiC/GvpD/RAD55 family RecA-like ATPase
MNDDPKEPVVIAGATPEKKVEHPRPKLIHELMHDQIGAPPIERLATGVVTLDSSMHGGIPCPRLVVMGGAPGACKTSFAIAIAHANAERGVPCAILAADEGRDGVVMRIAQRKGIVAARLQDGEGNAAVRRVAWEQAAALVGVLPMLIEEGDEDHVTVEFMAEWLSKIANGKPAILVVDSVQTVRTSETKEDDSIRARVDAVIRALKKIAKKHNLLVIAISEVGRGWYRNKGEQVNPMAAFKESGGIEYAAATAIVFSHVKDNENAFDAVMPKNRGYRREPFRLELDRARMTFREVPVAEPEDSSRDDGWSRARKTGPKTVPIDTVLGVIERIATHQPGLAMMTFRRSVIHQSDCGEPTAKSAISNALASGLIKIERSGRNDVVVIGHRP